MCVRACACDVTVTYCPTERAFSAIIARLTFRSEAGYRGRPRSRQSMSPMTGIIEIQPGYDVIAGLYFYNAR